MAADSRDGGTPPFWISAVPNGTATGVLAQHALRLNYTISCERLNAKGFPGICPGPRPFTASFSKNNSLYENGTDVGYTSRVCVPGDYATSPWDNSRDKRTITEEIYLGMDVSDDLRNDVDSVSDSSFAVRCEARTARGYFELGNAFNGMAPQPLLEKYPNGSESNRFNNYDDEYLCSRLGSV